MRRRIFFPSLSLVQTVLLDGSIFFLLCAFVLVTPQQLALSSQTMLAQVVSFNASVVPNQDNMLAAQFAQKEKELMDRESQLALSNEKGSASAAVFVALSSLGLSVVLLVLLIINFYFDMRRGSAVQNFSLDLRH